MYFRSADSLVQRADTRHEVRRCLHSEKTAGFGVGFRHSARHFNVSPFEIFLDFFEAEVFGSGKRRLRIVCRRMTLAEVEICLGDFLGV